MKDMDQSEWINIVERGAIEWSAHSLRIMFERDISRPADKHILCNGEIIESYPDTKPYPSALLLGFWQDKPLHVVAAFNTQAKLLYVITAYEPDDKHFEPDWKVRRVR
jgi:hypothetical protein